MMFRTISLVMIAGMLGLACSSAAEMSDASSGATASAEPTANPDSAVETTTTTGSTATYPATSTIAAAGTSTSVTSTPATSTTTPDGFSNTDWPADFDDYWPDPRDVLTPLPDDWTAPAGWVVHNPNEGDPLGGGWGTWEPLTRSELPALGFDDRLLAFDFNTINESTFNGRFISPSIPTADNIGDLPDGAYHAQLVRWDRSTPDRATFRIGPVMDCTPDGIWGEIHPIADEPLCGEEPGERHMAEPVSCIDRPEVCVELEIPLDEAFTVLLDGYGPDMTDYGWPTFANTLGQGPALADLLSSFHDDYVTYFVSNEELGPDRIEADVVPGSPFVNLAEDEFVFSQVLGWQRADFPVISLYKNLWWTDDRRAVTPWDQDHRPDSNGDDLCWWWEAVRDGYAVEGDEEQVPCSITEGFVEFQRLIRYWGSFMKIDDRIAWTATLPAATS